MDKQDFAEFCSSELEHKLKQHLHKRYGGSQIPLDFKPHDDSTRLGLRSRLTACEICGHMIWDQVIEYNLMNKKRKCNQKAKICPIPPWSKQRSYK